MSLHLPYLGGPASLGCLYDARTDKYITGFKLWSIKTMDRMTSSQISVSQTVSIESESNFSDKASKLELDASLKLSFLSGMLEVEKAGRYLNDSKTSINSETLTLQCSIKTEFRELNLETDIEYPQHLDDGAATHVVTGIQLGARAFLVFERELQDSDNAPVSNQFKGLISKFKGMFDIAEQLKTGFEECELEQAGKIQCRYYGDFELELPPLTLKEAIGCIESFSSENANSPVTVYLTPLSKLTKKPKVSIKSISNEYLNDAGDYCQLLYDVISCAKTRIKLLEDTSWHVQRDQLKLLLDQSETHRTRFTQKLTEKLKTYREKGGAGKKLAKILATYRDESPFTPQQLKIWMKNKERECLALQRMADTLKACGARMLKEPSDLDQFGEVCTGRILIEFLLPDSAYLQTCAEFLESDSQSKNFLENAKAHFRFGSKGTRQESDATWLKSDGYFVIQSELSRVCYFLGLHKIPQAGFTSALSTQHDSVSLQVKYLNNYKWVPAKYPEPPTDLKALTRAPTEAKIDWKFPEELSCYALFKVKTVRSGVDQSVSYESEYAAAHQVELLYLDPGTTYEAQVATLTALGESQPSGRIKFSTETALSCSDFAKKRLRSNEPNQKHRGEEFPGEIIQLKKMRIAIPAGCSCARDDCICPVSFQVGDSKSCVKPPKFLLIVGETGTGKSTFINGIANAFYRVRYGDNFRFKLIDEPEGQAKGAAANQAHSQTSVVAVYTLFPVDTNGADDSCKSAMDCPLTIIDTPGFGDTRGLAEDERIVKKIAKVLGEDGVSIPGMTGLLHAVGFVVKASQNRLTPSQKYIFDQALSLFGKDIEQIILPVLTFADGNEPQALAALKEDNVPHARFLKFNNGMLYADNSDVESVKSDPSLDLVEKKEKEMNLKANTLDWDRGELNYLKLFDVIEKMKKGVSLQTTKEVLKNRKTLELSMEGLMKRVKEGISMLSNLQQELDFVDSLDAVINDADKKKTRRVKVPKTRKVDLPPNWDYVTLCSSCTKTCHEDCAIPNDTDKEGCLAMDPDGNCTVCPGRCHWDKHFNNKYYFEDYEEEEERTVEEIAEKYNVNIEDRDAKKLMIRGLLDDFIETHKELSYNLVTIHKCLEQLDKLALRQYPLSVVGYVDNLIKVQETERKPGWEARVQHLRGAKESAEIIARARDGQDPFGEQKADVLNRCKAALDSEIKEKGLLDKLKDIGKGVKGLFYGK